ncbi:NAD-dependent deacetylase [Parapusillimonas sp. SGNA-6]|nr:NAD-dependent deacetylase [Parapusillimonas sp. SGNA-6]
MNQQQQLEKATRLVDTADMLLIVTGAGMGVDSGLPDFRGNAGFWRAYPALGRSRVDFTSIASPQAFREQPQLAWGFYGHRLNLYRQTMPHRGYDILKKWGAKCPYGCMSFTSNVDGHFQRAGFDAKQIVECHGSIHHLQCLGACTDDIWTNDDFAPQVDEAHCLLRNEPPLCPHCGGLARPNILMFGDMEWVDRRTRAQHGRLRHWLKEAERLLVIEIGAGTAVTTTRDFTHQVAFHFQAPVIRINPQDAAIHSHPSHVSLSMGGLDALMAIDALLSEQ